MERSEFPAVLHQSGNVATVVSNQDNSPGVSWGAVIAGAFVAAALSLILLALGTGLGLSAVTPWSNSGASGAAIGRGAILWLILMEIMASSMGGYLAGRLRTKWMRIHTDEVYFRDTAHGFLAWCVSLVITAGFLTSAAVSMVGGTPPRGGAAASSGTAAGGKLAPGEYFVDMLLRSNAVTPSLNDASLRREVEVVFANGLRQGDIPESDRTYLSQLVMARTGMSEPDAEKHVSDVFTAAQQASDAARKAVAHSLLWIFLGLLIGAFCASLAATIGGEQRDHVAVI